MKGLLVFLCIAVFAVSATPSHAYPKNPAKSVITDAIALVKCLTDGVNEVETSISNLKNSITAFEDAVVSSKAKLDACMAIGGANPSLSDQLLMAQCVMDAAEAVKTDLTSAVDNITGSAQALLQGAQNIILCL